MGRFTKDGKEPSGMNPYMNVSGCVVLRDGAWVAWASKTCLTCSYAFGGLAYMAGRTVNLQLTKGFAGWVMSTFPMGFRVFVMIAY